MAGCWVSKGLSLHQLGIRESVQFKILSYLAGICQCFSKKNISTQNGVHLKKHVDTTSYRGLQRKIRIEMLQIAINNKVLNIEKERYPDFPIRHILLTNFLFK